MKRNNEILEAIYLDYVNSFLSIHRMTEYYIEYGYLENEDHNEAYEELEKIINQGREINQGGGYHAK